MEENMKTMFKIFDPVILGPYPTYDPEASDQAIHLFQSLIHNKEPANGVKNKQSVDLLKRALTRTKIKIDHFVKRTRGLEISPDTHAPKDVVNHIIYSILVNDSATNLPYDMFFVNGQNPATVAASLMDALIVVDGYLKRLDIKNK